MAEISNISYTEQPHRTVVLQVRNCMVTELNATGLQQACIAFEPHGVFWNAFRTVMGILATVLPRLIY